VTTKSIAWPIIAALLLAAAGAAFWMAGETERRLAIVHQQLATLRYADAANQDDDVASTIGVAARIPRVGDDLAADVRNERATAEYWRADYPSLQMRRDASGALTESDPQLALLAANAEFRAGQHTGDRAELLRQLDRSVKTYADVLKSNPSADTAYNYEYVVRLRDTTQKAKPTPAQKADARLAAKAAAVDTDLPAGPTLHGTPGAPPKGTDMSQFKIVIPKRGEERKDNPEAGKGGTKVRKG
jgi:hypothetical protein